MYIHKKGFTLAEVLITLSIIGVVAALTIPSVVKSYEKAQYIAGYKKTYSALSQMAKMMIADHGSIEGALTGIHPDYSDTAISPYLKFTKICNSNLAWHNSAEWYAKCAHASGTWSLLSGVKPTDQNPYNGFGGVLADGTIVFFWLWSDTCTAESNHDVCGELYIDTNGMKGPNVYGKDLHTLRLTHNGVFPMHNASTGFFSRHCSTRSAEAGGEAGSTCGHEILMNNYDWEDTP